MGALLRHAALATGFALAALALRPSLARADEGEPPEVEAERLAHMLSYVAVDYGGAVKDGIVVSEIELDEQISILNDAAKLAERIQAAAPPDSDVSPDLAGAVGALRGLVQAKAGQREVAEAATALRVHVEDTFRLAEAPIAPPDRALGAALFAEHCSPCHGLSGHGDTARAATLTPRPADFHDPTKAVLRSPLRIARVVRFGVGGTAMVPFNFLSDEERWAIAFHVAGLRYAGTVPSPLSASPTYSVVELAVRSDAELTRELDARGVPADLLVATTADLRLRAPYDAHPPESRLLIARAALDEARRALRSGETALAGNAVERAARDGFAPAEAWPRPSSPGLGGSSAPRGPAARAALDAGAPPDRVEGDLSGLLREATYAEVTLATPTRAPRPAARALAAAAIVARDASAGALLAGLLVGLAGGAVRSRRHWAAAIAAALATWIAAAIGTPALRASWLAESAAAALTAAMAAVAAAWILTARRVPPRAPSLLAGAAPLSMFSSTSAALRASPAILLVTAPGAQVPALAGAAFIAALLAAIAAAMARAVHCTAPAPEAIAGASPGAGPLLHKVAAAGCLALALALAGHAAAAAELAGAVPILLLPLPRFPALGVHPTLAAAAVQTTVLGLALLAAAARRRVAGA